MGCGLKIMARDCCVNTDHKAGGQVPRPLGDTVYGTELNAVVQFDFLYFG